MQTAPWLGLVPGGDGQVKQIDSSNSPLTTLFNSATDAIVSNPTCPNPSPFLVMSKQAEAASEYTWVFFILVFVTEKTG